MNDTRQFHWHTHWNACYVYKIEFTSIWRTLLYQFSPKNSMHIAPNRHQWVYFRILIFVTRARIIQVNSTFYTVNHVWIYVLVIIPECRSISCDKCLSLFFVHLSSIESKSDLLIGENELLLTCSWPPFYKLVFNSSCNHESRLKPKIYEFIEINSFEIRKQRSKRDAGMHNKLYR